MGRLTALALVLALAPGCHDHVEGNSVAVTLTGEGPAEAFVTVELVELVECPVPAWVPQLPSLIGTAHAHSEDTSTRLGRTTVLPLDGGAAELGTLEPADGDYCRVRVSMGPADADAEQIAATAMEGLTFKVAGVTDAGGISAAAELPSPLELSGGTAATLAISVTFAGDASDVPGIRDALRTGVSAVATAR